MVFPLARVMLVDEPRALAADGGGAGERICAANVAEGSGIGKFVAGEVEGLGSDGDGAGY